MKILFEIAILVVFFLVFKLVNIYAAIAAAMAMYSAQILAQVLRKKPVQTVQWVSLGMVLLLGGASLLFRNELFFKWKPSIVYVIFAIAILATPLFTKEPTLKRLLGSNLTLPQSVWPKLDYSWAFFFTLCSVLNLVVAYHFETETWVYFKLFGSISLIAVFMIIQAFWLAPYIKAEDQK